MAEFKRILHPTDFSTTGKSALPLVERFVRRDGAELHLLHVLEPMVSTTDFTWAGLSHNELEEKRMAGAREALAEFAAALDVPAHRTVQEVVRGKGHEAICDYAERVGIDLVVMATHGHAGLSHLLLGSVTELVVRSAPCPVLTVKSVDSESDEAD